jgi:sulfate permease, SulP family
VPGAIVRVPDGMASAVLVGANPVYGVYASMAADGRGAARLTVLAQTGHDGGVPGKAWMGSGRRQPDDAGGSPTSLKSV